jgi:lysophospholipase L1-like esterase
VSSCSSCGIGVPRLWHRLLAFRHRLLRRSASESGRLRHGEGTRGSGARRPPPPEGARVAYALAYSGGQFDDFARLLEKLLRQGRVPDAILLSGGGNDIAGNEFAMLLNHAASGLPPLNDDVVRGVIDVRTRNAYAFLISGLTEIAMRLLKRPIPIIVHGYDYPVPDGRGFLGGFGPLPGPWLQPGFHRKGHSDLDDNIVVTERLIDAFNTMLRELARAEGFGHVRYVNLRGTLSKMRRRTNGIGRTSCIPLSAGSRRSQSRSRSDVRENGAQHG